MENNSNDKTYWKSIDEKYSTPEFQQLLEQEFMSSPLREDDGKDGLARRQFLKLMGASMALSATACVRRPVQKIIPYNKKPDEIIHGVANYYSSAWYDGTEGFSVLIKTLEGRPLHVQGNASAPGNGKGLSPRAAASILSLYDPDRIKTPILNSIEDKSKRKNSMAISVPMEKADAKVIEQLKKGGVVVWAPYTPSATSEFLIDGFCNAMKAKRLTWQLASDNSMITANKESFGDWTELDYDFSKASYVLSIDADFLGTYLTPTKFSRDFSKARNPDKNFAKLVSFQSVPSLTSLNSDDNYPITSSQQIDVVMGLIHQLIGLGVSADAELKNLSAKFSNVSESLGLTQDQFKAIAKDLAAHKGKSIVITGGVATENENGVALKVAVNALNDMLNNFGATVVARKAEHLSQATAQSLNQFIESAKAGEVKTLIIHGVNPLYSLNKNFALDEALAKVEMVISTSNWMDETASHADVIIPSGHAFENWNEYELVPGVTTIQQPTIRPLHASRSFEDSLITWAPGVLTKYANTYELISTKWTQKLGSIENWHKFLQEGTTGEESSSKSSASFKSQALRLVKKSQAGTGFELSLYTKMAIGDGSMANVSWLQELPDPVTKVVWDNYVMMSPVTAQEMGLKTGGMIKVKSESYAAELPVLVTPGMHKKMLALAIGYGRSLGGEIMKDIGFAALPFAYAKEGSVNLSAINVEVSKARGKHELAVTQGHQNMAGRQIVAEASVKSFKEHGETGLHKHKIFSIWSGHKYEGHKWAMAIDLNSCTGCSACVISCQSENNIPVVGKKHILNGREMHWIRIDRYYKGDENNNPDAVFQPVMCQHCENAPCETVCPVVATVHSDEGLNDMVYNRCVGTRYCSNNCPYKVRRFNWFYYDSHHKREPLQMALNPEVTVRTRGVMEKCTFCVHRIKEGKNTAKDEGRELKDGDIKTACEAVCPTDAIVFGDLNDKTSRVAQWFENKRNYTLLEEVHAAPRVRYLAKLRNTDRDMGNHHAGAAAEHPAESADHKPSTHGENNHGEAH